MSTPFRTPASWRERQRRQSRLGTLDQVISTIVGTESNAPRLNNPGSLSYAGQPGATLTTIPNGGGGFIAQFDTLEDGQAALVRQIQLDASRGLTISQFTAKYAPNVPGSGNNPVAYANYIANATGLSVNDPLSAAIAAPDSSLFVGPTLPGSSPAPAPDPASAGTVFYPSSDPSICDPTVSDCTPVAASSGLGGVGLALLAAVALVLVLNR